jgi:hypothetical protein
MATVKGKIQLIPYDPETYIADMIEQMKQTRPEVYEDFLEDNSMRGLINGVGMELGMLAYMANANTKERFLKTCRSRRAAYLIGRQRGYDLKSFIPAQVKVRFYLLMNASQRLTIPKGFRVSSEDEKIVFQVMDSTVIDPAVAERDPDTNEPYGDVACVQGESFTEVVGSSNGKASQEFVTTYPGAVTEELAVEVGNQSAWVEWTKFDNLTKLIGEEKAYSAAYDDESRIIVTFGNMAIGAVPPLGASIRATYRVCEGVQGNVAVNIIIKILDVLSQQVRISNLKPATGGLDPEPLEEAKRNIFSFERSYGRLVSLEDYQNIYRLFKWNDGGIFKSTAKLYTGGFVSAIYVAALALDAEKNPVPVDPKSSLGDALMTWINERKSIATFCELKAGATLAANLKGKITYEASYRENTIRANVEKVVEDILSPDVLKMGAKIPLNRFYIKLSEIDGLVDSTITMVNDFAAKDITPEWNELVVRGNLDFDYEGVRG